MLTKAQSLVSLQAPPLQSCIYDPGSMFKQFKASKTDGSRETDAQHLSLWRTFVMQMLTESKGLLWLQVSEVSACHSRKGMAKKSCLCGGSQKQRGDKNKGHAQWLFPSNISRTSQDSANSIQWEPVGDTLHSSCDIPHSHQHLLLLVFFDNHHLKGIRWHVTEEFICLLIGFGQGHALYAILAALVFAMSLRLILNWQQSSCLRLLSGTHFVLV